MFRACVPDEIGRLDPVRDHGHPAISALVMAAMKARAIGLRFLPRRRRPTLRTATTHPIYPKGYEIEALGP